MNLSEYLTIKEAAEFLGVVPATLKNWERDHKIIVYRHPFNRWRLYKKEDLEAILKNVQKGSAQPNTNCFDCCL